MKVKTLIVTDRYGRKKKVVIPPPVKSGIPDWLKKRVREKGIPPVDPDRYRGWEGDAFLQFESRRGGGWPDDFLAATGSSRRRRSPISENWSNGPLQEMRCRSLPRFTFG